MLLLARIYEVFPLRYPLCGADMRIIAFVTEAAVVRDLLIHVGEPIAPPTPSARPAARRCGRWWAILAVLAPSFGTKSD